MSNIVVGVLFFLCLFISQVVKTGKKWGQPVCVVKRGIKDYSSILDTERGLLGGLRR